jgi:hypothetical protein
MTGSPPSFCPITFGPNADWYNANLCCFASGTKISTVSGEVPVENLQKGDSVLLGNGKDGKVKWIGRRHITTAFAPQARPVRISHGAIADNIPSCDLIVSPEHGIYLNGVLIPARALVNGTTVAEIAMKEVTYYHVEFDRHTVIFAEGLAVESFLDTGVNAGFFSNAPVTQFHVYRGGSMFPPAHWRTWIVARISGAGTRVYNLCRGLGVQTVGQVFFDLSLNVVQRIQGACAPRAYFGEAVDKARQMINIRGGELGQDAGEVEFKCAA